MRNDPTHSLLHSSITFADRIHTTINIQRRPTEHIVHGDVIHLRHTRISIVNHQICMCVFHCNLSIISHMRKNRIDTTRTNTRIAENVNIDTLSEFSLRCIYN